MGELPILRCKHNSGFYSCCMYKLWQIIQYYNTHETIPKEIDVREQFRWYKGGSLDENISYDFFLPPREDININFTGTIDFDHEYQWINFKQFDYSKFTPFIRKYYTPTPKVFKIVEDMEKKYNLKYENLSVLFYRGNDKRKETKPNNQIPPYREHVYRGKDILKKNPETKFIIQSDETEYIDEMKKNFPDSIIFYDEIRHMKHNRKGTVDKIAGNGGEWNSHVGKENYESAFKFMAIMIIMSKCKNLVLNIGNCSLWVCFFRENAENVDLWVNNKWN
jgi:hypothetical protein